MTNQIHYNHTHHDIPTWFHHEPVEGIINSQSPKAEKARYQANNPYWSQYRLDEGDSTSQKAGKYALRFFSIILPFIPIGFLIADHFAGKKRTVESDVNTNFETLTQSILDNPKTSIKIIDEENGNSEFVPHQDVESVEKIKQAAKNITKKLDENEEQSTQACILHLASGHPQDKVNHWIKNSLGLGPQLLNPNQNSFESDDLDISTNNPLTVTLDLDNLTATLEYNVDLTHHQGQGNKSVKVAKGVAKVVLDFFTNDVNCAFEMSKEGS